MDAQVSSILVAAVTAFGSTIAATPVRYVIDKRLERNKEQLAYEYEQRRALADLVGRFHGRLVEAGDALHQRLLDVWRFEDKGWLDLGGDYDMSGQRRPYFFTTVYRAAAFSALSSNFERSALYIDKRLADPVDIALLNYVKALRWVLTDTRLFDGLNYDFATGRDHLYRDMHRSMCDGILLSDANEHDLYYREFTELVRGGEVLTPLLQFLDGLHPDEPRLRWDRLVCFDLLLMAMLNAVGYDVQDSGDDDFTRVASEIRHPQVARNLAAWIPRLGLANSPEARLLDTALHRVSASDATSSDTNAVPTSPAAPAAV